MKPKLDIKTTMIFTQKDIEFLILEWLEKEEGVDTEGATFNFKLASKGMSYDSYYEFDKVIVTKR